MGITMSGLLVRMEEEKVRDLLEDLFDRKLSGTSSIDWDYYRQFDGVNSWEIASVSDGQSTALYFGDGFSKLAIKLFPDSDVDKIPADYLFYDFVESAMVFIFSYKKSGTLQESYFGMEGSEFEHWGEELLGLTLEHDIAQDGLHLALKEFGIDINNIKKAKVYLFSPEIQKADHTDNNLRYLVRKLSREVYLSVKNNSNNSVMVNVLNTLNKKRIHIASLALSGSDYKSYKEKWSKLDHKQLEDLDAHLIDSVIRQNETEKSFAQLIYLHQFNDYKKAKSELMKSLIPAVVIVIILLVFGLIIYFKYK